MASARLAGHLIDRAAIVTGTPQDFSGSIYGDLSDDQIYDRLRERIGSPRTERFKQFIKDMRREDGADLIEGEIENGGDDDAA